MKKLTLTERNRVIDKFGSRECSTDLMTYFSRKRDAHLSKTTDETLHQHASDLFRKKIKKKLIEKMFCSDKVQGDSVQSVLQIKLLKLQLWEGQWKVAKPPDLSFRIAFQDRRTSLTNINKITFYGSNDTESVLSHKPLSVTSSILKTRKKKDKFPST